MADQAWTSPERGWAALVTIGVVGATLLPLRQYLRPIEQRVDGFPFSHYPMFSARRGQYEPVVFVVAVRGDGSRYDLPHGAQGTGGVNQVRRQLQRAVEQGWPEKHARIVAKRVAGRRKCADVVRVEITVREYDLDGYMTVDRTPRSETVLAKADIPRAGMA